LACLAEAGEASEGSVACLAVARGSARLRPLGFGAAAFTRFASEGWWARQDSNLQPDRYERWKLAVFLLEVPIFIEF